MPDLVHRRLRAPPEDGTALIDPPLSQAAALIERNRAIGVQFDDTAGFPTFFRAIARRRLLERATLQNGQTAADPRRVIIVSGHQPELFHPGVWFKNFVLHAVAHRTDGQGINLIIDSDVIRAATITVPAGSAWAARAQAVAFDAPSSAMPWEYREVADPGVLNGFAAEVRRCVEPFIGGQSYRAGLIVERLWPHVVAAFERHTEFAAQNPQLIAARVVPEALRGLLKLGHLLATGRFCLEREIGLQTIETAMSTVCRDPQFSVFADGLLKRHQELHAIHNAALAEYRVINKVRAAAQPIPDLTREGDWYEVPFWILRHSDRRRRRAFARQLGALWELSDREGCSVIARGSVDPSPDWAGAMAESGFDLRPRALLTTMYARLVLSDLFIHGIGGAKYDELTDLIIRRFFGIEPPAYVTATATFRLPIERPQVTLEDVRQSAERIREVRYRPEAFLHDQRVKHDAAIVPQLESLAAEKREYLAKHDLRRCSQEVFERLDRMNRAMHARLRPVEEQLRAEHAQLVELAKQSQLLASREFSFCLFPSEILPARLLDLCKVSS